MSEGQPSLYTPVASPLPPPPDEDIFTPDQWTILLAIADTIVPSIRSKESTDSSAQLVLPSSDFNAAKSTLQDGLDHSHSSTAKTDLISTYLEENASSLPGFKDTLKTTFGRHIHNEARRGLTLVLTALGYVVVTCGR